MLHRYQRGMRIPDFGILVENDTRIIYFKYDRRGEAKVVPKHLVHPKVFATLVENNPN